MTYDPIDTSATDNAADGSVTTATLDSTTVDNSGTVTTQDIVVNGTATGPFGGGGVVLEAGDSITVESFPVESTDASFVELYNGVAKDVLGGTIQGRFGNDFLYEFSDGTTITQNTGLGGTSFTAANTTDANDNGNDTSAISFLPPAKDVVRVEVGTEFFGNGSMGAIVLLKD